MRLKGGKVLLDLTGYGDLYAGGDKEVPLKTEEIKAIKEKGLSVMILSNGEKYCCDLIPNITGATGITYHSIFCEETEFSFRLSLDDDIIEISEL